MEFSYQLKKALWYPVFLAAKGISGTNFNWFNGRLYQSFFPYYQYGNVRIDYPKTEDSLKRCGGFFFDAYEDNESELIQRHMKPDDTVLELGACLGFISCLTQSILGEASRSTHTVVEANPAMIPHLKVNRALNDSRFEVIEGVIAEQPVKLVVEADDFLSSQVNESEGEGGVVIPHVAYSELPLAEDYNVWIMDIEGGEISFIQTYQAYLSRLRLIIVETHPDLVSREELDQMECLLRENGLRLIDQSGPVVVWSREEV